MKKFQLMCVGGILIGISCLIMGFYNYMPYYQNQRGMVQLRAQSVYSVEDQSFSNVADAMDVDNLELSEEERDVDFDYLKSINPDIDAWIYIPDTHIDYPVLRGKSLDEYLSKGFDGKYNELGSIFTFPDTEIETDDHILLFGHRTMDRQMFGDLEDFLDETVAGKTVLLYFSSGKCKEYSVIMSYRCSPSDISFDRELDKLDYWQKVHEKAEALEGWSQMDITNVNEDSQILTLVTCPSNGSQNSRIIVQCIEDRPEI